MIKTFRGLLADGGQDRIRLQTIKGKVGYRISKFQLMGPDNNTDFEVVLKIYKKSTTPSTDINFTDTDLLAAGIAGEDSSRSILNEPVIIFDTEIFNQDIYITNKGHDNTAAINYYIELELIPLASDEAAITTVKAMRGTAVD